MSATLHVDQDKSTGQIQVAIWADEMGGYRLAGPKYTGNSRALATVVLGPRDVREILRHLRHEFEHPPGGGYLCNVCAVQHQYHDRLWGEEP
jgi:hypothetical protein